MKLNYILIICIILIILTGCLGETTENHPKQNEMVEEYKERNEIESTSIKTLEDFKSVLQTDELELMPVKEEINNWILNSIKPNKFTVGKHSENTDISKLERVSIYIFESEDSRKKGLENFYKQIELYDMMIPRIYEARNVLVFYWALADMDKPAEYEQQFQTAINQLNTPMIMGQS